MQPEWKKVGVLSKFEQLHLQERDLLGRPRRRWEGNIRMDPKEMSINMRNGIDLAQDRDCWRSLVSGH